MKKIAIMFLLLFSCCFMTGCFGSKKSDIASDFKKTVDKSKAYHLTGELEIVNNENYRDGEGNSGHRNKRCDLRCS